MYDYFFFLMNDRHPKSTLFPYTTLFRSARAETLSGLAGLGDLVLTCTGALSRNRHVGIELGKGRKLPDILAGIDRKSTRLNSSHMSISYAVFCLKKKK